MDGDGTKAGFDLELTRAVSDSVSIPVIASGGVGNLQHLVDGIVEGHADAVLAASIFHFGDTPSKKPSAICRSAVFLSVLTMMRFENDWKKSALT